MNKECLFGFLAGVGAGIGVAFLFAPKSGEDTRALIAGKAREGTDYVKHQAESVRDSATSLIDKGIEEVARHRDVINQAIEAGRHAYQHPHATHGLH